MDRILIILKKENGPRASSAPALGLNTMLNICLLVYAADSGERLQDHWSSGNTGPEVIKHFSSSTQLSMKFQLIINAEIA